MKPLRTAAVAVIALVVASGVLLVGCEQRIDQPTITLEAAGLQVDAHLTAIEGGLPEGLRASNTPMDRNSCYSGVNGAADGRRQAVRSAFLEGLPEERVAEVYQAVRANLEAKGFTISTNSSDGRLIGTSADGFDAILSGSLVKGDYLILKILAPCVWENGTPPPKR
ncbi:hypothetical protein [Kitasatospora herbaricolor]|uniref:hypothetical protein n=1 Tax=Kitasatospora herbaricolor TaxID=68217 RepID=UPI0036D914CE